MGETLSPRTGHHCIISGTGRAGTSFLVQLLSHLGLDTGFDRDCAALLDDNAKAGLEHDLRNPGRPYIVKSPWICDYIDEIFDKKLCVIDHAFIPIRDLDGAARSRIQASARLPSVAPGSVPGGLWHTGDPARQADVLAHQLHKLLSALTAADVPITLISYPRLTRDPDYLFGKLAPLMAGKSREAFMTSFAAVMRPDWVHSYALSDK